jgi:preprotein translocase subunit YajC
LIIPLLLIGLLFAFSARARRRQATNEASRNERIAVGTEVMTTSGLHGTVVAKHDDGTASLSIAPGVEVRWELVALRDVASLPNRYRRGAGPNPAGGEGTSEASGTSGVQLSKED